MTMNPKTAFHDTKPYRGVLFGTIVENIILLTQDNTPRKFGALRHTCSQCEILRPNCNYYYLTYY